MFGRKKRKPTPKSDSGHEPTGTHQKPKLSEDQTATLKILLGDTELEIEQDAESGGDPHDNSGRFSLTHLPDADKP